MPDPRLTMGIDNLDVQRAGSFYLLGGNSMSMRTIDGEESLSAATTTTDRWQLHDLFRAYFPAGLPQYLDKIRHLHGRRNPHHQATHVEIDHGSWVHVEQGILDDARSRGGIGKSNMEFHRIISFHEHRSGVAETHVPRAQWLPS